MTKFTNTELLFLIAAAEERIDKVNELHDFNTRHNADYTGIFGKEAALGQQTLAKIRELAKQNLGDSG